MAAARGRQERSGPGWIATLAGAALLIVAGFGVGLVAGTAFEEPELVMDHLSGRTTDVALEGPSPADDRADAAARPDVPAAAPAAPAAVAAAPPSALSGGFAIQVGAFSSREAATDLARQLDGLGMPTYVADETGGARYKVRVGPIATREEATRIARRLKTEHRLPTWVLSRER